MVDIFLQILDMSITASWVILAVMVVRFLLRKAPKKYAYALWIAPLFRLICPVSFQSVVSAFNFSPIHRAVSQTGGELQFIPRNIVLPQINPEIPTVDTGINTVISPVDTVISTVPPVMDTAGTTPMPSVIPEASVNPLQILIFAGMVIWLVGMAAMVTVSIVNYFRLKRGLRFAVRMAGNVWQCEAVRSPFLVGLIKPKIYLPYGLDGQTQEYILAHERYHLKRFDHIAKLLGYTALTVHWFNPLCHLAFRLMNGDMEMSCDEHVLERNNIPTTQYSYSLLTIATNRRFPAATPLAFAETGVKERMINVLNWKKPKKWVSVVAVMVCAILLISCTTNPKASALKADDPVLLEFPGLKWGMTVEQVKDALNIKEEQILLDREQEYEPNTFHIHDERTIYVKDLNVFGCRVTLADFSFVRVTGDDPRFAYMGNTGSEFILQGVRVFLDEETDMEKLEQDMTQVYGQGVGGIYQYIECLSTGDPVQTSINANPRVRALNKRDSVFQEALNDPGYKEQMWICTDPMSISDSMRAYFIDMLRNKGHNDEQIQEWMNQSPWVTLRFVNNTFDAICIEAGEYESPYAEYITRNSLEYRTTIYVAIEQSAVSRNAAEK